MLCCCSLCLCGHVTVTGLILSSFVAFQRLHAAQLSILYYSARAALSLSPADHGRRRSSRGGCSCSLALLPSMLSRCFTGSRCRGPFAALVVVCTIRRACLISCHATKKYYPVPDFFSYISVFMRLFYATLFIYTIYSGLRVSIFLYNVCHV